MNVLTLNGGSSSIKFALFPLQNRSQRFLAGQVRRIGLPGSILAVPGEPDQPLPTGDVSQAGLWLLDWIDRRVGLATLAAVGHRVVHGGPRYAEPQLVSSEVLAELHRLKPLSPTHLPGEIALIEAVRARAPELAQIACFDTAFHHYLPRVARILPIPRKYEAKGVRRYGFHGISFAYLLKRLQEIDPKLAQGRVIFAHLGNGSSLAAVRAGHCIDTTMAFTPAAGLIMGTRSGDLDPGLLVYLQREKKLSTDQLDRLISQESGLLGISETTSDMQELLAARQHDERAADAVAAYGYCLRKAIGAFAAALGGLDAIVFSGGIGEHSPEIRRSACEGLEFLGLSLDDSQNAANSPSISAAASRVIARIIPTDEEAGIFDSVRSLLAL